MTPLVDTHCHVLAGLDDGARDEDEALRMCEIAYRDGIRAIAATAHQSESYPSVSAVRIAEAVRALAAKLREARIDVALFGVGEAALNDVLVDQWRCGRLHPFGKSRSTVLLEFPTQYPGDFLKATTRLLHAGIRPIIAHAERYATLRNGLGYVKSLVDAGCLIQVTSVVLVDESHGDKHEAAKDWVRRRLVHLVGSDAHDAFRRRPMMLDAYAAVASWTNRQFADRICGYQALALLNGGGRFRPAASSSTAGFWSRCRRGIERLVPLTRSSKSPATKANHRR